MLGNSRRVEMRVVPNGACGWRSVCEAQSMMSTEYNIQDIRRMKKTAEKA